MENNTKQSVILERYPTNGVGYLLGKLPCFRQTFFFISPLLSHILSYFLSVSVRFIGPTFSPLDFISSTRSFTSDLRSFRSAKHHFCFCFFSIGSDSPARFVDDSVAHLPKSFHFFCSFSCWSFFVLDFSCLFSQSFHFQLNLRTLPIIRCILLQRGFIFPENVSDPLVECNFSMFIILSVRISREDGASIMAYAASVLECVMPTATRKRTTVLFHPIGYFLLIKCLKRHYSLIIILILQILKILYQFARKMSIV